MGMVGLEPHGVAESYTTPEQRVIGTDACACPCRSKACRDGEVDDALPNDGSTSDQVNRVAAGQDAR